MSEYFIANYLNSVFSGKEEEINESRYKYKVGDIVEVSGAHPSHQAKDGMVAEILSRRNGYPEPHFHGFWFPLYFLKDIGEIGEGCVKLYKKGDKNG